MIALKRCASTEMRKLIYFSQQDCCEKYINFRIIISSSSSSSSSSSIICGRQRVVQQNCIETAAAAAAVLQDVLKTVVIRHVITPYPCFRLLSMLYSGTSTWNSRTSQPGALVIGS